MKGARGKFFEDDDDIFLRKGWKRTAKQRGLQGADEKEVKELKEFAKKNVFFFL